MSESIKALRVLRDAARTMRDLPNVADSMIGAYLGIECAADRAIASLEAAKQPEPCATIPLPESASELPHCSCGYTGWPTPSCSGCGKPLSAEAHQPPAEQPCAMCVASNCVCHCKLPCSKHSAKAAPVPAPASIPLAQHEAALAEARREGLRSIIGAATQAVLALGYDTECRIRNAISKDCGCAGCHRKWAKERLEAAIRALAEKGGEVGK